MMGSRCNGGVAPEMVAGHVGHGMLFANCVCSDDANLKAGRRGAIAEHSHVGTALG